VLLAATSTVVVATATAADAHASLVASTPADGGSVDDLDHVVLRFTSPVDVAASHVWVEGERIETTTLGPAHADQDDPTALEVDVPPLPQGAYRLGFHVPSEDGDVSGGTIRFGVGVDAAAPPRPASPRRLLLAPALAALVAAVVVGVALHRPRKEPRPT
jgi:methionine-rich copper-binding protein CopC